MLGGFTLEEDGEALSGRAAQKRRLALLALLATAPGRTMSRDRIMAIIWPEKDGDQARHLLSVAVYEVRKELGEEVVITRGDDLVLDPSLLTTDVEAFEEAVEAGDLERAVDIYAGPFLDGFHLGGSTEFDQWADLERDRRERELRRVLEALAEERERAGDVAGAVDAWRSLASHDRYNSRVASRLLRALYRAGNPAGALQFARVHAALLREEFGTEPSPEFAAAVEELKSAPPAAMPGAAAPTTAAPPPDDARPTGAAPPIKHASPTNAPPADDAPSSDSAEPPEPEAASTKRARAVAGRRSREGGTPAIVRPLIVLTMILLGAAVGGYWATRDVVPYDNRVGIAVLPFDPMSMNEEDEAYADGLTEEIMDALGKVAGVRVPARSASFALRGVDAPEAARRLGVAHILEGSVRRDGDRLRIRVELSEADGPGRWRARWSQRYDYAVGDVFATWDEIALAVLDALEVELGGKLPEVDGGTTSATAFDLYLKGRHAWFKRTPEGFSHALSYFERAVDSDPRYARAYAGIADVYNLLGAYDYGVLPPDTAYPRAKAAAERALSLAPRLAEAHAALANTRFAYDRDLEAAEASYREAIALNPRYAEAHHWYGLFLIAAGRPEESIREAREALALDSLSSIMRSSMARQLYFRGDYEGALRGYRATLALEPGFVTAHHGLGLTLLQLGRYDDAAASFRSALDHIGRPFPLTLSLLAHALARAGRRQAADVELSRLDSLVATGAHVPPESRAIVHLGYGDREAAIDALEAAFAANSSAIAFLGVEPLVDPLRGEPRFERLRERERVR